MTDEDHPHDDNLEDNDVRRPAVAGQFYPSDKEGLRSKINHYLGLAETKLDYKPKAIIVPHAGYEYSGEVAASAYKQLEAKSYDRVLIICNSHSDYFNGIAIDESEVWETPLGQIEVDFELAEKLVASNKQIQFNSEVHSSDHTLEVQLPFLQTVLEDGFKIVPVVFGNAENGNYNILAEALNSSLGENDLLVISTDLSHYPTSDIAREIDEKTLELIKDGDIEKLEEYIKKTMERRLPNEQTLCCGIDGVKTLMALAKVKKWKEVKILNYMNSGDVSGGDKTRVVGYGAVAFGRRTRNVERITHNENGGLKILKDNQKNKLLDIAKNTIENYIKDGVVLKFEIEDERLQEREGAFVTLKIDGHLRGCIGQIVPSAQPLWQVVQAMAIAAATDDPRFQSVSIDELEKLEYEISVLFKPEKIDDWKNIVLGRDGVIVRSGGRSGVFLPQVADEVDWNLEEFLAHLCADKAGLARDAYKSDPDIDILTFQAQVF